MKVLEEIVKVLEEIVKVLEELRNFEDKVANLQKVGNPYYELICNFLKQVLGDTCIFDDRIFPC
jgi:hypothetical protein